MADKIEGMSIGLSLDSAEMQRGLKGAKDRLKTVNSEMKSTMSQFDRGDQSIGKYETRLKGLNKKLDAQEKATKSSKEEYERMVREYGEGSKEAEKAEKAYHDQSAELNNLTRYVNNATQELEEMKRQQKIANSGWTKSGKKITAFGDKISSTGGKIQGFGKKWSKVTGAAAGAAAGLGTAIFGLTNKITDNADAVAKGADKMGVTTDFYQEMDYWAGQNGISTDNMTKAMERLNQRMGRAANGNKKYTDALKMLDIDMDAVRDGTLSTEDAMAQSIQTLSEMESQQKKSGVASELFGTKLSRDLMPALQDGSLSMEDAKKKAEELGIVISEDQLKASEDFQDSYDDIKRSIKAVGEQFGLSFMPTLQKGMDWLLGHMPDIRETVSGAFNKVKDSIKTVALWFQNLSPQIKKAVGLFAGIAAAIGPVSMAIGTLMKVFGPLVSVFGKASTFIGKFGGLLPALKAGFVALTGPVGLTVAAITGIVTAFTLAYKKSETFRNVIGTVIQKVKEFAAQVKPMIMQGIKAVVGFFKNIGNTLKQFWQENSTVIIGAIKNIWTVVQPVITAIFNIFKKVFPLILQVVKSVWGNIKGVISGALDVIMGLVKTFSGLFTGNFSKMWEGIKQVFSGAVKFVWNYIQLQFFGKILKGAKALLTSFTGVIKSMWSGIKNIFMTVIKAVVGFFKRRFTAMKNTAKTIMNALKNAIKTVWSGIKSIFTKVIKSIVNFAENWFTNLKNNIKNIFNAVKTITKAAWDKVKQYIVNPIKSGVKWAIDKFNSFKSTVANIFGKIKDGVSDKVSGMIKSVKDMPGKMADGLKKGVGKVKTAMKKIGQGLVSPIEKAVNGVISGINWILEKVNADKINKWNAKDTLPALYAGGTKGHPDNSPAVVGDGKGSNAGSELVTKPNGESFLSPDKPTLMPMERGTQVTPARETRKMLGDIPHYAFGIGGIAKKAWKGTKYAGSKIKEGAKYAGGKVKEWSGNVWDFVSNPGKLLDIALTKTGLKMPDTAKMLGRMAKGAITKVKDDSIDFIKDKLTFSSDGDGNYSGQTEDWIKKAVSTTGSPSSWVSPLATIAQKESGGRTGPSTVNTWDINAKRGTPSMGLMQTIRPTFNAHKKSGMDDIMNPVHNAVAAINYIKSRYGTPFNVPGIQALRQGKPYVGYEKGTNYVPQTGMAMLHKGEAVMPADQNRKRTDAMKLLAMVGNNIGGQSGDVAVANDSNSYLEKIVDNLSEQVADTKQAVTLLAKLLSKDNNVYLDAKEVSRQTYKHDTNFQNKDEIRKSRGRGDL